MGTLRHGQFARFIAGATVASIGQFLSGLATPFYMNELTDSNAWVGASGFAGLIPAVFLTPLAGILADRISRRILLTVAYGMQTIAMTVLLVMYLADALTPWRIIFIMLASGSVAGFMFAPLQSMAPTLVPRADLVPAVQLLSIAFTVGRAIGPGLGALVLWSTGPGLAYGIAVGCLVFATAAMASTHPDEPKAAAPSSLRRDFIEGIRYIRARPAIGLAVKAAFAIGAFGAVWAFSLAASVADDAYGVGGGGLGLLATMIGVGSVGASIFISRGGSEVRRSTLEPVALSLYAIGVAIAASTPWFYVGMIGYFTMGIAHMWHNVTLSTSLQVQVEESHRGRVMSVFLVAILGGLPIGAIVGGALSDLLPIRVVMGGSASLIGILTVWWWFAADRFHGLDGSPVDAHSSR
ncbi:MAG: MFS transporter [Acidimicrobiales bacterium]|nr:MFS transporter [Acidimicrobiales bacterium]